MDYIDVDDFIASMPGCVGIPISCIKLIDGTKIENAVIEERAPRIQGFIAIATKRKRGKLETEATKYINLNRIAGFVIDNEVLARVSPSYFIPEPEIKIKR